MDVYDKDGNKIGQVIEDRFSKIDKGIPIKKTVPDTKVLEELLEQYVKYVGSQEYHEDNDFEGYIYEAVMEAFYDNFFDWFNDVTDND